MNAQDFRSLQEAYMEVVENQQIDEISTELAKRAGEIRMNRTFDIMQKDWEEGRKKPSPEYQRSYKKFQDDERRYKRKLNKEQVDIYDLILSHLLDEGYKERPVEKMVKKAMDIVNRPEYDGNSEDVWRHNQILRHTTKKKGGGKQRKKAQHNIDKYWARLDKEDELEEQYDLYDIILSHLLDEGYADTEESAQVILAHMSDEWRDSIIG